MGTLDLEALRDALSRGEKRLRITAHAQVEGFKDGLELGDLRFVLETGRAIESYPERRRLLLFAATPSSRLPVHIVVEDSNDEVVIVSSYVPDPNEWIAFAKRRRKPKK